MSILGIDNLVNVCYNSLNNRMYPNLDGEVHLLSKYNLSISDYEKLLEAQDFGCKICGKRCLETKNNVLMVDHCHKTDKVRGLLCGNCNSMLGHAKDNPTILLKAIQYLKGNLK